jgi:hypothetical protein
MAYFQNKNPNLGNFFRPKIAILEGLALKMLVYFMTIWYGSLPFGIFYGHLVFFTVLDYFKKNLATLHGATVFQ